MGFGFAGGLVNDLLTDVRRNRACGYCAISSFCSPSSTFLPEDRCRMVMYHSFAAILVLHNHCSIFAVFRSDASHAVLMSWKAVLGRSSLPAS